jgi:hypothetical protein
MLAPSEDNSNDAPMQFDLPAVTRRSCNSSADDIVADGLISPNRNNGSYAHNAMRPVSAGGVLAPLGLLSSPQRFRDDQLTSSLHNGSADMHDPFSSGLRHGKSREPANVPRGLAGTFVSRLASVYLTQVDPILKTLHAPTIERWLIHGDGYLQYPERHPSIQALQASICYVAVSSMTEQQCETMLQQGKSKVTEELYKACETSFRSADLIFTNDITVLQAFVLYLVSYMPDKHSIGAR